MQQTALLNNLDSKNARISKRNTSNTNSRVTADGFSYKDVLRNELSRSASQRRQSNQNNSNQNNSANSRVVLNSSVQTSPLADNIFNLTLGGRIKGDLNNDGKVDSKDIELFGKYNYDGLTEGVDVQNADVNDDGEINLYDHLKLIEMVYDKPIKGDANGDGQVNFKDVETVAKYTVNLPNDLNIKNADMNNDGEADLVDLAMILDEVIEKENSVQKIQGDVNGDGKIDDRDYKSLQSYVDGSRSTEDFIRKNSDVNNDGVIDGKDLQGVRNILDGRPIDWNESKRILGDASGDGKIDITDAVTILNYVNKYIDKKDFYSDNADVNYDGKIDLEDAVRIKKFLIGDISSLDQEISKIAPPFELATITQQSEVYSDFYFVNQFAQLDVGQQVRVTGMSSDGTALEVVFPTADGGEAIGWVSIQQLEKSETPPPPEPVINYPYEAIYNGNRAIWVYTDENLTNHSGNDVVLPGKTFTVLGENDKAYHISYTNSQGVVLDRWFPKNYPAQYQEWTAFATNDKAAFQYEDLTSRIGNEAVFAGDVITVLDEHDNAYQVKYWSTAINDYKIRWVDKADIQPYDPNPFVKPEHVSEAGIEFIKGWEGFREEAYKPYSSEKYYTIGYGHYGDDVYEGRVISREEAENLLREDLIKAENAVKKHCAHLNLNQNQFDALVSFTFNCGEGNLKKLLHGESGTENRPLEELPEHMPYYRKAGGKISSGLENRRAAEIELFNTPVDYVTPQTAPITEPDPLPPTPQPYQEWTGIATQYTPAFQYEDLTGQIGNEAVFANDKVTVLDERDNAYQVKYWSDTIKDYKTRWVSKADIVLYQVPDVPQKLQELIDYWTAKGKWDNGYWSGYKKGVAGLKDRPRECKEFASMIFSELFLGGKGYLSGGYIGSGSSSTNYYNWRLSNTPSNVYQVDEVSQSTGLTAVTAKALFDNAQSGDFIQIKRGHGGAHSAILTRKNDQGVWFFEANADGKNTIQEKFYSWDDLVGKPYNVAMSIYRAG